MVFDLGSTRIWSFITSPQAGAPTRPVPTSESVLDKKLGIHSNEIKLILAANENCSDTRTIVISTVVECSKSVAPVLYPHELEVMLLVKSFALLLAR
jgi:hypothetical protein